MNTIHLYTQRMQYGNIANRSIPGKTEANRHPNRRRTSGSPGYAG